VTPEAVRRSKRLSLVLRHEPSRVGVTLDAEGWVPVPTLLAALETHGWAVTREQLAEVVDTNDKQRFEWDLEADRIRARQGHSVEVDLALPAVVPPDELYHGTPTRNVGSILATGLERRQRQHVHLSADVATAEKVGSRRGAFTVLAADAARMHADGHEFRVSTNGVWLVDAVPAEYLSILGGAVTRRPGPPGGP
jgi:putative RNA 2'-phosphotransferase